MPEPAPQNILIAALHVFREEGYADTTLEKVARHAKVDPTQLQAQFKDKEGLFTALLRAYSPLEDLLAALEAVEGNSAEDLIRDAMGRMVKITQQHDDFFELVIIDTQINNGTSIALTNLSAQIFPKALTLLDRLKATGQIRPVSDAILGRTVIAMLIGFVLSERAMPQLARLAMRFFPQRAWLDGMIDLMLYGILEDDQR